MLPRHRRSKRPFSRLSRKPSTHTCTSSLFPRQLTHCTLFALYLPPPPSERGVHGNDVTPFLLQRVNELTGGESLKSSTSAVGCEHVPG